MPRYRVLVPELHYAHVLVDADTPEKAQQAAADGQGDFDYLEFSHTTFDCSQDLEWEEE